MMTRSAHSLGSAANRKWREAWDHVSDALLKGLSAPRPDFERVRALLVKRQRLTTAMPPADPDQDADSQKVWLERAVVRERALQDAFTAYRRVVQAAHHAFQANAEVRSRYTEVARTRLPAFDQNL
ncbi:MAG: hypothetical protein ACFB9M_11825 [Myxococcota bacterium]